MKKLLPLILLFLIYSAPALFGETVVKAEVDKVSVTTDDQITYKLTITSSEKNIPAPKVPKFDNFIVLSQAQSSQISLKKGDVNTFVVYAFVLAPAKVGKFKIEPSVVDIAKHDIAPVQILAHRDIAERPR
ncbi:MAG: BatD family protein, partial [Candidatus Omnitrophica bacterium]|nr:BatD family protein [Candidatus Omnitrophota bacterium]